MEISMVGSIKIEIVLDGESYIMEAVPKTIKRKYTPSKKKRFAFEQVLKTIAYLGYQQEFVDVTHIMSELGAVLHAKSLWPHLVAAGYTEAFRMKFKDGRNHYIRYNPSLITKQGVVSAIKS